MTEVRQCPTHGLVLVHYPRRNGQGGGQWKCPRCNVESVEASKRKVIDALFVAHGAACVECVYDRLFALRFYHADGTMMNIGRCGGMARSLREASICRLLCLNCGAGLRERLRSQVASAR